MGAERRVVYDLVNVIQGEAKLARALRSSPAVPECILCNMIGEWLLCADARENYQMPVPG